MFFKIHNNIIVCNLFMRFNDREREHSDMFKLQE